MISQIQCQKIKVGIKTIDFNLASGSIDNIKDMQTFETAKF